MSRPSIVRESKFRHVFAEAFKEKYDDVRPSSKPSESVGIRCNGKWIAVPWESGGGGSLAVFSVTKTGRLPRDLPLVTGHNGAILDFEFSPFVDDMLATASEDNTVRIWQIPDEGMKSHMKEAAAVLSQHQKKVLSTSWNPTASNILASTDFAKELVIWNVEDQAPAAILEVPDQAWSMKWNYTGSLLGMGCKDKKLHIVDPRKKEVALSGKAHDGAKGIKVEWMGKPDALDDSHMLLTTGFSGQAERQIGVWDLRKFGGDAPEPLNMLVLDTGTGTLLPAYDAGTGMFFCAGKGDANVRYFEMDAERKEPYIHFITQYSGTVPSKGFDWLPKRCVDTTKHEAMRGYQLQAGSIVPISFRVPRKADTFQEDIFPDCPSGEASMSASDWVGGSECKPPKTMSMRPGERTEAKKSTVGTGLLSVKDLKAQLETANARIKELEAENAKLKEELEKAKA
mmetsp:Transcript_58791/g.92968  ORF Transcript_58791/g.92968 Transcript_58791/m.92968 type:complete len:455 (-) Transcript_58791:89-1453(-)